MPAPACPPARPSAANARPRGLHKVPPYHKVTVPAGVAPGSRLKIRPASGGLFAITVPLDAQPGQTLRIQLPTTTKASPTKPSPSKRSTSKLVPNCLACAGKHRPHTCRKSGHKSLSATSSYAGGNAGGGSAGGGNAVSNVAVSNAAVSGATGALASVGDPPE